MNARPRARVYGKKKGQLDSLNDSFAILRIGTAPSEETQSKNASLRFPLRTISLNPGQQCTLNSKQVKTAPRNKKLIKDLTETCPVLKKQLPRCRTSIAVLTSLEHVKDEIYDFEHACDLWAKNYVITKIAHGSYAAIFRLQLRSDKLKYIIAKLIPIKPNSGKGSRAADQTSFEDAATEVKALDAMSEIPGFVGFSEAWVLRGALPILFQQQYEIWAQIHPDDGYTDFSKDQLWCFIEMSDAGTDLERVLQQEATIGEILGKPGGERYLRPVHCWDIFWGIVEALGRGEEFAEFEHRDLHPGNICITKTDHATSLSDQPLLRKKYTLLEVTLIDYTLSRATLINNEVLANPMRDKSIFEQRVPDPHTQQQRNDNRQYEAYRQMRKLVMEASGCEDEVLAWQSFVPQTNVIWLHHILSLLLSSIEVDDKVGVGERRTRGAQIKEKKRGTGHLTNMAAAGDDYTVTEEATLCELLEKLKNGLDANQKNGCKWGSAKALMESELYWSGELRVDDGTGFEDEHG